MKSGGRGKLIIIGEVGFENVDQGAYDQTIQGTKTLQLDQVAMGYCDHASWICLVP